MEPLCNTHVKLLAFDLLSLTPSPPSTKYPHFFYRKGRPVSRSETLGIVTSTELKPGRFLKFTVDDGTGCVPCILWLNQLSSPYFSRRNPSDVQLIADAAATHSSVVQLGLTVRVRGRITDFRGTMQITVCDVVLERDPNAEILHWLDCVNLARNRYDVLSSCK